MSERERDVIVERDGGPGLGWVWTLIVLFIIALLVYMLFTWWMDGNNGTQVVPSPSPTTEINTTPNESPAITTSPSPETNMNSPVPSE